MFDLTQYTNRISHPDLVESVTPDYLKTIGQNARKGGGFKRLADDAVVKLVALEGAQLWTSKLPDKTDGSLANQLVIDFNPIVDWSDPTSVDARFKVRGYIKVPTAGMSQENTDRTRKSFGKIMHALFPETVHQIPQFSDGNWTYRGEALDAADVELARQDAYLSAMVQLEEVLQDKELIQGKTLVGKIKVKKVDTEQGKTFYNYTARNLWVELPKNEILTDLEELLVEV